MPFTPDLPIQKSPGDAIRSKDWNDLVAETQRLDTAKVNRAGDAITGPLTIAGALGVGTTGPTGKLNVVGSGGAGKGLQFDNQEIKFRGDGVAHFSLFANRVAGALTIDNTSQNLTMGVAGTNLLTFLATGNVGIGTTGPNTQLHLDTASNAGPQITLSSSGGGKPGIIFRPVQTSAQWGNPPAASITATDNNYSANLHFHTKTPGAVANAIVERLTIQNDGNVGIGTTTPGAQLHLYNTAHGGDLGIGQQNEALPYLRLGMDTNYVQYLANNAYWTGSAYNYVNTAGYSGYASAIRQNAGQISLDTAHGGANPITWVPRLVVGNDGNVSINGNLTITGRSRDQKIHTSVVANTVVSTTSTTWVDIPGMSLTVVPAITAWFQILVQINGVQGTTGALVPGLFRLLVDGVQWDSTRQEFHNNGWELRGVTLSRISSLAAGSHTISVQWAIGPGGTPGGTVTCCWYNDLRQIQVVEL